MLIFFRYYEDKFLISSCLKFVIATNTQMLNSIIWGLAYILFQLTHNIKKINKWCRKNDNACICCMSNFTSLKSLNFVKYCYLWKSSQSTSLALFNILPQRSVFYRMVVLQKDFSEFLYSLSPRFSDFLIGHWRWMLDF